MTKDVQDAIRILKSAQERNALDIRVSDDDRDIRYWILRDAIRHLAYPDRDVYPKVRHARKTNREPRLWRSGDDIR